MPHLQAFQPKTNDKFCEVQSTIERAIVVL